MSNDTTRSLGLCLAVLVGPSTALAQSALERSSAITGKVLFLRCQSCHSLTPGQNGFGPTLASLVGRKAGSVAGFNYSDAMKSSGIVWNEESLDSYLANPRATVPGNRMAFPGIDSAEDRAALIEFLRKPD